jgi:hypothetical protein
MPALLFTPLFLSESLPPGMLVDKVVVIEEESGRGKSVQPSSIVEIEYEGIGQTEKEVVSSVASGLSWRFQANDRYLDPWMPLVVDGASEGAIRTVLIRNPLEPPKRLRVWIRRVQTP